MLYQIQGTVVESRPNGPFGKLTVTHQIPTFYLNSEVQGIVDKTHAEKIAGDILNPAHLDSLQVNVTATTE